ncbi:MAG: GspH/FimT family pseudopilin [Gammaproteobacteria bacterium]|nr:GspH/FimT family pseudopilin [Gammaproteobacteria bacterium]
MNKRSGFTLVELLITLVVAAVLLAWGVPSFNRFLERTTLTSETNTWVGVINHARNEAITRSDRVTVCRSQNPDACQGDANCDCGVTEAPGSPPNYHSGYLIFTSTGNPQAINFRPGLGNELIRTGRTQTDRITIRGNGQADNAFSFMPDGTLDPLNVDSAGVTARHVICTTSDSGDLDAAQNSEASPARVVVISQTGRPRVDQLGPTTCSGTAADALSE